MATNISTPAPPQGSEPNWTAIERSADFKALVSAKMRFIIPATIVFVCYYFALPILVGYAPDLMQHKVIGSINLAYLFALSEFAMAWIVMGLYVRRARDFDVQEKHVLDEVKSGALR
jgi:uncharacterized membrane protein (DUF485 family)